jgi:ABC-type spermidine/putrescine transport system permease subunit II
MNYQIKLITLWAVFLLGLIFHTQLGLMPLFHGLNISENQANALSDVAFIFWLMLAFFVLPMAAMVLTLFNESRRYRKLHFGLTILYTFLNFAHLVADLFVTPIIWYQITLMAILVAIGLLLNLVSWQWLGERKLILQG